MGSCQVMLVLMFFVASVVHTKAIDCNLVGSTIFSCSGFLKDSNPTQPHSSCCNAAENLFRLGDVKSLCQCLTPFSTQGFLSTKARQIPSLCNLPAFTPLTGCFAWSTGGSFLPPLGPLPPVFPFPPFHFPPLPPFNFPPLPPFNFPPLPPLNFPPLPFPIPPAVPNTPMPVVPDTPVPAPPMPAPPMP